ncbi:MAG TPA: LLM class flavin-dependent oxidoreductase [Actinomycetales bacterium]
MRFGLFVPQGWRMDLAGIAPADQWKAMHGVAAAADVGSTWESVWVYDHFHTVPIPSEEATHEAWTLMAAFAASTTRVRLGQMCTCMAYRNPAYLAKVAAPIDVISGGRVEMGIGAGWYEHEWRAYGYGFPSAGERLAALDEGVQIEPAVVDRHGDAAGRALPGRRRDRPTAAAAGGRHPAVDRRRR